ncbi:MAG: metal-sensitive transcriptional regulator [Dehalococcoidia bacterium]
MKKPEPTAASTIHEPPPERNLNEQAKLRLRKIEGQVRGIQGMLDRMHEPGSDDGCNDDVCDGLLTQVLAVRAAVEQVGVLIMELHMRRCVLAGMPVDEERLLGLRESLKLWTR